MLWSVLGCCGVLWGCCGVLWCIVECSGVLWSVLECCGDLWSVVECCGVLWGVVECCGGVVECQVNCAIHQVHMRLNIMFSRFTEKTDIVHQNL